MRALVCHIKWNLCLPTGRGYAPRLSMSRRDPSINVPPVGTEAQPGALDCTGEIPPMERTIHVNISTNLADLMLNPRKAEWNPSPAVISTILQKEQFTDLNGSKKPCGDLSSVVLHHVRLSNACSNIPVAVGLKMTGIEENVFSPTAQRFAAILPENAINQSRVLEHSDKSSTQTFASKFPGYTASNLAHRNVYKVESGGVVFAASDHPMIQAIQENAESLGTGHFAPLEGKGSQGLYSIGQEMWDQVLPHVLEQVQSQVRTCDMTGLSVRLSPADYSSWAQVRQKVIETETAGVRANFQRKMRMEANADARHELQTELDAALGEIEDGVDHKQISFSGDVDLKLSFLGSDAAKSAMP